MTFAIRPAMEITTVLYYQLNIDYIVEKYCVNKERPKLNCNGKCYLMNQMKAKTQPSSNDSKTTVISEAFIPLFFQDNSISIKENYQYYSDIAQNWKNTQLYFLSISKDIDHPPEKLLS